MSGELCTKLKTSKVNLIQDEAKPENWFIEPATAKDDNAFELRFKKESYGANGMLQSSFLAREILSSSKLEVTSTKLLVGSEIEKDAGYPIITKSGKQAA